MGGEPVSDALWKRLTELGVRGAATAVNLYGPTECTVDATAGWITEGTQPRLGEPLPGVRLRLADTHDRAVAVGRPARSSCPEPASPGATAASPR